MMPTRSVVTSGAGCADTPAAEAANARASPPAAIIERKLRVRIPITGLPLFERIEQRERASFGCLGRRGVKFSVTAPGETMTDARVDMQLSLIHISEPT